MSIKSFLGSYVPVGRNVQRSARAFAVAFALLNAVYVTLLVRYPEYTTSTAAGESLRIIVRENITSVCPLYPNALRGRTQILLSDRAHSDVEIQGGCEPMEAGGVWSPESCTSPQSLAVIIPYRDRPTHLSHLLTYLHPLLQRQHRDYRVFLVEQAYNDTFNKGRIMNIGFTEAMKFRQWDCVIFHDVDMIPENDNNLYVCADQPRHLSPALDEMRYTLMYRSLVGGALAVTPTQFRKANGFSNLYWGWGAEDDDMAHRLQASGYSIIRPPFNVGRYKMVRHQKRQKAKHRYELLNEWGRFKYEGVSQIPRMKHHIVARDNLTLYTHVMIDIGPSPKEPLEYFKQMLKPNNEFHPDSL